MAKQDEPGMPEGRDRPVIKIEITHEMVRAAEVAICRWADRYGIDDLPAINELARSVLLHSIHPLWKSTSLDRAVQRT